MPRRDLSRYGTTRTNHASVEAFLGTRVVDGINTIDYHGSPLDLLVQRRSGADTTIVMFHAAITSPTATIPLFTGTNVTRIANAHTVFVSDPSLELDEDLTLAWFAGSTRQAVQADLPAVLRHVLDSLGSRHTVFYGGSGGGFAALFYSAHFPGSLAVGANPQTDITKYARPFVENYARACWAAPRVEDTDSVLRRHTVSDLREVYQQWPGNTVAYMQSLRDWHLKTHMVPFLAALPPDAEAHVLVGEWGDGHTPPPKELVSDFLEGAAAAGGDWAEFLHMQEFVPAADFSAQ